LASYESLGSAGCTVGQTDVAGFATVSGITGATAIDPSTLVITPTAGTSDALLTFSLNLTATTPALDEAIFTYTVTGPALLSDDIALSNSSETVDGAVTDIQNYCAGGQFGSDGVTGCSGSATGTLLTLDGIQNTDQTSLLGPHLLNVTDDFTLDGGTAGSATGGKFSDHFMFASPVPEPPASILFLAGAVLAWRCKQQFARRAVDV